MRVGAPGEFTGDPSGSAMKTCADSWQLLIYRQSGGRAAVLWRKSL
jgi:hypothetical protein